MNNNVIHSYQELAKIFLGIQLNEVKQVLTVPIDLENLEKIFAKSHYYQLDKSDVKFGDKFKSNLILSREKKDHDYLEYLESLLQAVNPILAESVNLSSPTLDVGELVIKRKPKILSKPQIIAKTNSTNKKDVNYVSHQEQVYQISERLRSFLTGIGLKNSGTTNIATVKQSLNKYIETKNLQILSNKTHFKLDKALKNLFPNYADDTMSYAKLRLELKHHFTSVTI